MKSALVIGGSSALSTAIGLYGMPDAAAAAGPRGVAERHNRQHAWDAFEAYNEAHEQTPAPSHALVLHLDYELAGEPQYDHRRDVAETFQNLERAFEWSHEGVLFTVGYSVDYFERFDDPLPPGLDPDGPFAKPALLDPRDLIETEGVTLAREDPEADRYDVAIHMASDHVQNLLAAEEALWGFPDDERTAVNGVDFADANFDGIFDKPDSYPARRTGFAGNETVTERLDEDTEFDADRVHDDAELSMGFNDIYRNSVPRETNVTMVEGQQLVEPKPPRHFAQGTIQHISALDVDLSEESGDRDEGWYDDHDLDGRRERMFSPHHTEENTGEVGENLGNSNAPGEDAMRDISRMEDSDEGVDVIESDIRRDDADDETDRRLGVAERVEEDARERDVIGHAQKLARARFDLEERLTEVGERRIERTADDPHPADEPEDELPGHDVDQEAEQVILRRDLVSTDRGRPGNTFVALMRFNPYMVYIRRAMNGVEFDTSTFGLPTGEGEPGFVHDDVSIPPENDGILNYITTRRRGNYLVPPLTQRALPYPRPATPEIDVEKEGDVYLVAVRLRLADVEDDHNPDPGRLDRDTVRFGYYRHVNRGGGAEPLFAERRGGRGQFVLGFDAGETELGVDDRSRARLVGKLAETRKPVFATATVDGT